MTATAFAHDPLLDQPAPTARPQLRLVPARPARPARPNTAAHAPEHAGRLAQPVPVAVGAVSGVAGSPRHGVEVYRRRRFLVAMALTVAIVAASQLLGISLTSFGSLTAEPDAATPAVHVVRPGDTYAGIAAALGAHEPLVAADQLRAANANAELVVGERLVVDLAGLGELAGPGDLAGLGELG